MLNSCGLIAWIRPLLASQAGSTAIVFSLSAAVVLGGAGMAVDYARTKMALTSVQANLDAAVLAGASGTLLPDKQIETAEAYFTKFTKDKAVDYKPTFTISKKGTLVGTVEASVPTTLLRVLDINQMTLKALSEATSAAGLEPLCFMAMHPTRKHTLEMKGSVSLMAPDCNIYGNSDHDFDVVDPHTPQNFMTAKFVAAIGGGHHFLENVSPPVEFGTRLVEDPLKGMEVPSAGACTQTGYVVSGKSIALPAGHYCKGLTIENGSKVELEAGGTYFISGGAFEVDSSVLTGKDVTIFLTDAQTEVLWSKSTIRISAARIGTFAGIAVFGERTETENVFSQSTIDIHGVFYMPLVACVIAFDGEF